MELNWQPQKSSALTSVKPEELYKVLAAVNITADRS